MPIGKPRGKYLSVGAMMRLDLGMHGIAFMSCAVGAIWLDSVVLTGAATHHAASLGFRMATMEHVDERSRRTGGGLAWSIIQIIVWTACVLLALIVAALGAHGLFHVEPFDSVSTACFALPGLAAAATTARVARRPSGKGMAVADVWLSAAPTVLALSFAIDVWPSEAGKLDAAAGLVLVLLLCARSLLYLGRALD